MRHALFLSVHLGLVPFLSGHAAAQELVWERTGVVDTSAISGMVIVLGDVDGDGFDDVLVSHPATVILRQRELRVIDYMPRAILRSAPNKPQPPIESKHTPK